MKSTSPPKVFISYRRSDTASVVGRIDDRLVQKFGRNNIFKDVDSIPVGSDFRQHIENGVGICDALLVVIGKNWLASDASSIRRIDDPRDYVRLEIEAALNRNIPVIPTLVEGISIPDSTELPDSIADLVFRGAVQVRSDPDFHADIDHLIRSIEMCTGKGISEESHRKKSHKKRLFLGVAIIVCSLFTFGSFGLWDLKPSWLSSFLETTGVRGTKTDDIKSPPPRPSVDERKNDTEKRNDILKFNPPLSARAGDSFNVRLPQGVAMTFRFCPRGSFRMGTPNGEPHRDSNETQVTVRHTKGFWLAETECSQEQFKAVMKGWNPSAFEGDHLPIENVSWDDAKSFLEKLNSLRLGGSSDWKFTLPTEAQWEYACRAGTKGSFHTGRSLSRTQANFGGSATWTVGSGTKNDWGFCDMHGNVVELCNDSFEEDLQGGDDPKGPKASSEKKVSRGGAWNSPVHDCRSGNRSWRENVTKRNYLGFRVCLSRQ